MNHGGKKLSEAEFLATTRTNKEKSMGMLFDRRCPYCDAKISDDAKKCPKCGEWLISETEQKNLKKTVESHNTFQDKLDGFIGLVVLVTFLIVGGYIAIDSIIHLVSDKTKDSAVNEKVIEQQSDVIDTSEDDYKRFMREKQEQERKESSNTVQQTVQPKPQPVPQPQKQIQQVPKRTNVVVPQAKPVQTQQQSQDIDDFMN